MSDAVMVVYRSLYGLCRNFDKKIPQEKNVLFTTDKETQKTHPVLNAGWIKVNKGELLTKALRTEFRLQQKLYERDYWGGINKGFEVVRGLDAEWILASQWNKIFEKEVQDSWPTRELAASVLITRLAKKEKFADHKLRKMLDIAVEMWHDKVELANTDIMEPHEIDAMNLKLLNEVFFDELGFRVNAETFYDPENTYLDMVIERRVGIPISLSILYMAIAKILGINMSGLGLPSRFIMTYEMESKPDHPIFIDAYTKGTFITEADCKRFIRQASMREQIPYPLDLEKYRLTSAGVVLRLLYNLTHFYRGDDLIFWKRNYSIVNQYMDKPVV